MTKTNPLKKSLRGPKGAAAIPRDCFVEPVLSRSPLRLSSGRTVEGLAMTSSEDFFRGFNLEFNLFLQ